LASRGVTAIELKKKSSDIAMMSIDPTQKRERPTLLHPLLPRFTFSKLERRYRDDRLGYRLTALRVSFVAGIAIWMLFVALDLLTIHDPSIPLFYIRIAGTLSLIPFFLATFLIKPGRWIEVIGFAAVFIQIVLLTALVAFLSPVSLPYYQPTEVGLPSEWQLLLFAEYRSSTV
jgi:hypothetical protein